MEFLKKFLKSFTAKVDDDSERGKVNSTDLAKVVRNATYVGIAAALTFMMTPEQSSAFAAYEGIAIIGLTALLDFVNKLAKDNKEK